MYGAEIFQNRGGIELPVYGAYIDFLGIVFIAHEHLEHGAIPVDCSIMINMVYFFMMDHLP